MKCYAGEKGRDKITEQNSSNQGKGQHHTRGTWVMLENAKTKIKEIPYIYHKWWE